MLDWAGSSSETIAPQPGPQERFLSTSADVAIFGGAAGGGKTYALLLEPLRHIGNPQFDAVIFRKEAIQVMSPGGLFDTSFNIYGHIGAVPKMTPYPTWQFKSGASISFNHLNNDATLLKWQGAQIALIGFDELSHFSKKQFFYLLSRNRSMSGIRPYVRATTNPDVDSWVAELIAWWIDQDTGYAIPERSGQIRYFTNVDDNLYWGDSAQELKNKFPASLPKSLTFISSRLTDNKKLMDVDPGYLANLMAMGRVDRERLLQGNWKVREQSGSMFPRSMVSVIPEIPTDVRSWVRRWDLASTTVSEKNPSPDATAGVLMGLRPNGRVVVADGVHVRENAHVVREIIKNTASQDKARVRNEWNRPTGGFVTIVPIDPGQAGKEQAASYVAMLAGYNAKGIRETGPKETRAEPFSSQWCAGNVDIVSGQWNRHFLTELEGFPEGEHDDWVDAASGAYLELSAKVSDFERRLALAQ